MKKQNKTKPRTNANCLDTNILRPCATANILDDVRGRGERVPSMYVFPVLHDLGFNDISLIS